MLACGLWVKRASKEGLLREKYLSQDILGRASRDLMFKERLVEIDVFMRGLLKLITLLQFLFSFFLDDVCN